MSFTPNPSGKKLPCSVLSPSGLLLSMLSMSAIAAYCSDSRTFHLVVDILICIFYFAFNPPHQHFLD